MITQETAALIFAAYREIETAQKLLSDMAELYKFEFDKHAPVVKDAFGKPRNLQLGIPSGECGHRVFDVHPKLAESILRAHIERAKSTLAEMQERARVELFG